MNVWKDVIVPRMKELGFTQVKLQQEAGFSISFQWRVKTGERLLTHTELELLAKVLHLDADKLKQYADSSPITPHMEPSRPSSYKLVGRKATLETIRETIVVGEKPCVVSLSGKPGVGKTALVTELAHDDVIRNTFSDGILWAQLGQNADALGILGSWCKRLGYSDSDIASFRKIEERKSAVRSGVGDKKLLLVADDVWTNADALAFHLDCPNCAYILTTRRQDVSLSIAGQARSITINELEMDEAVILLQQFVPNLVEDEPETIAELVAETGALPLAIVLMGKYLERKSRKSSPRIVEYALKHLRDTKNRLRLTIDDLPTLTAVIELSYKELDHSAQQSLRSLSIFPPKPNSFSLDAAISITLGSIETIEILQDTSLLEGTEPDRLSIHATIRDYAREQGDYQTAIYRAGEFFNALLSTEHNNYDEIEVETVNIEAICRDNLQHGNIEVGAELAVKLFAYLEARGEYELAYQLTLSAVNVRSAIKSRRTISLLLRNLAIIERIRGNITTAIELVQEALDIVNSSGDEIETNALINLSAGALQFDEKNYDNAIVYFTNAIELAASIDQQKITCAALRNLGAIEIRLSHFEVAKNYLLKGLEIARKLGMDELESGIHSNLGTLAIYLGDYSEAYKNFQSALECLTIKPILLTSQLLLNSAALAFKVGNLDAANSDARAGLQLAKKFGLRRLEAKLLSNMSEILSKQEQLQEAEDYARQALTVAGELGDIESNCGALINLGEILIKLGKLTEAESRLAESVDLAETMKNPQTIIGSCLALGELLRLQGKFLEAEIKLNVAIDLARNHKFQEYLGIGLYSVAKLARDRGDNDSAKKYGIEAKGILEEINHNLGDEVKLWLSANNIKQ